MTLVIKWGLNDADQSQVTGQLDLLPTVWYWSKLPDQFSLHCCHVMQWFRPYGFLEKICTCVLCVTLGVQSRMTFPTVYDAWWHFVCRREERMSIVWSRLVIHWQLELLLLLPFCCAMNIQPFTAMHTVHLAVLLGLFIFHVALQKIYVGLN